jgi:hypothetical protein
LPFVFSGDLRRLCALLCYLPSYRRHDQQRVYVIMRLFLENALARDDAVKCLTTEPPQPLRQCCDVKAEIDKHCHCVSHFMTTQRARLLTDDGASSQSLLGIMLLDLWQVRECGACRMWLRTVIEKTASFVDGDAEGWNRFDGQTTKEHFLIGPKGKRRRVNNSLKDQLMHDAVTKSSGVSTAKHIKGLGLNLDESLCRSWERDKLCERKAARWLTFEEPQPISIAFDGARIGKPSRSIVAGLISSCTSGFGAVMTPQDRSPSERRRVF